MLLLLLLEHEELLMLSHLDLLLLAVVEVASKCACMRRGRRLPRLRVRVNALLLKTLLLQLLQLERERRHATSSGASPAGLRLFVDDFGLGQRTRTVWGGHAAAHRKKRN